MGRHKLVAAMLLISFVIMPVSQASDELRYSAYHHNDDIFLEPGSGEAMVIDALIFRPVGLVTTVIGTAVFVVSLPFSALGGNVAEAAEKLVVEPVDYTFKRKLGDL